jgi:hypothetical protein
MKEIIFDKKKYPIIKGSFFVTAALGYLALSLFTINKVDDLLYMGAFLAGMIVFQICKYFFYDRNVDVTEVLGFIILVGLLIYFILNFDTLTALPMKP